MLSAIHVSHPCCFETITEEHVHELHKREVRSQEGGQIMMNWQLASAAQVAAHLAAQSGHVDTVKLFRASVMYVPLTLFHSEQYYALFIPNINPSSARSISAHLKAVSHLKWRRLQNQLLRGLTIQKSQTVVRFSSKLVPFCRTSEIVGKLGTPGSVSYTFAECLSLQYNIDIMIHNTSTISLCEGSKSMIPCHMSDEGHAQAV